MNYDVETLKQINEKADLISYAETILDLKQRGNDEYFAHCPFHEDKTPSLSFTKSKNSFYCFSCGVSGKMIGFLMKFENMRFDEAIQKASRLANISLDNLCQSETISFLRKVRNASKANCNKPCYHQPISKDAYTKYKKQPIKEWLDEGISQEVLDLFEIRFDEYGNRIVYPVYDINGNLINIKGRTLYENYKALGLSKYMNYYKVGTVDYFQCLNITLPYIKSESEVIVFESIKSVMKAFTWGYKNCISAEKHTLTDEQIKLLLSLKANIILAFDSDVSYTSEERVKENIDTLRRFSNLFIINDKQNLLGGAEAKNSPVDCGLEIWEELYDNKQKVV